jgi:hypothetical protein
MRRRDAYFESIHTGQATAARRSPTIHRPLLARPTSHRRHRAVDSMTLLLGFVPEKRFLPD